VHHFVMMDLSDAIIMATERLNDGVIVRFEGGRCVFYSASLLYKIIPQAEEQDESPPEW
jgi:hypothetical protein